MAAVNKKGGKMAAEALPKMADGGRGGGGRGSDGRRLEEPGKMADTAARWPTKWSQNGRRRELKMAAGTATKWPPGRAQDGRRRDRKMADKESTKWPPGTFLLRLQNGRREPEVQQDGCRGLPQDGRRGRRVTSEVAAILLPVTSRAAAILKRST